MGSAGSEAAFRRTEDGRSIVREPGDEGPLVVVGAGMAAQRLCEDLAQRGIAARRKVVLIGEESCLPYDRIRLGEVVRGGSVATLHMRPPEWYESHRIEVRLSTRVVSIDRAARRVSTSSGDVIEYGRLVLATGSRPRIRDPFDVADESVLSYRSWADATAIRSTFDSLGAAARCLVVGGGLLGLEVAYDLLRRGGKVIVLEAASHVLSRQLDLLGGRMLERRLAWLGIDVRLAVSATALERRGDELVVQTTSGETFTADLIVLATGVRPEDELARRAGLTCHHRGGVRVDAQSRTDDPFIDAIGECASYDGEQLGLVAPCYDMARVVAERIAGGAAAIRRNRPVAKLKIDAAPAYVVGRALVDEPGFAASVRLGGTTYRRIVTRRGRLVGAAVVGDWDEVATVIERVERRARFGGAERDRFLAGKQTWSLPLSVEHWPSTATLCTCTSATCGAVRAAVAEGCRTVDEVGSRTGAGTVCGSCRPQVERLVGVPAAPEEADVPLAALATVAAVAALAMLALGPIGYAATARGESVDFLWRDSSVRQITGFGLAGLCAATLVLSARKRIAKVRFGKFRAWRWVHSGLGALTVAAAAVHTGMRLGDHLNAALMSVFLLVVGLGALAAGLTALTPRLEPRNAVVLRRGATLAHQIVFWPLPVLIALHAFKTFFF